MSLVSKKSSDALTSPLGTDLTESSARDPLLHTLFLGVPVVQYWV